MLVNQGTLMIERYAIRAILLTPDGEILLFRIATPDGGDKFWIAPGGGLEPGETIEAGLRRELREEVGLEDFAVGPLVWRRQHTFDWAAKRILQREEYYIVHVPRFEPYVSDDLEMQTIDTVRWWPVVALGQATERLTPLSLADIVTRYLAHGPPKEALSVEVLVD
jgi:8-oxo-dGTP pyrophosphatase MutT (NUDIX family)